MYVQKTETPTANNHIFMRSVSPIMLNCKTRITNRQTFLILSKIYRKLYKIVKNIANFKMIDISFLFRTFPLLLKNINMYIIQEFFIIRISVPYVTGPETTSPRMNIQVHVRTPSEFNMIAESNYINC